MRRAFAGQHATAAALFLVTIAVFWPALHLPFIEMDDPLYVSANPMVAKGLTAEGLRWAFTTFHAANWHPLTWAAHTLDVQLFGLAPGGHHAVSILIHALSAALLFWVLRAMTGSWGRSATVAALFSLHPLRVESVAWVAERKDVLSGFFWVAALFAYLRWTQRPRRWRYLAVLACLALGLLSKPIGVTLPLVLLLLDFWPLGRLRLPVRGCGGSLSFPGVPWSRLIIEKTPFLALAAASGVITFVAQQRWGAVSSVANYPLALRVGNALVAYARYLQMTLWPQGLTIVYPYPNHGLPAGEWLSAGALLAALTGLSVWFAARLPSLAVGWLWYLGTLVPVIGLVQAGLQSRADRYTYLPHIGLFIAVVWGVHAISRNWTARWKTTLGTGVAVALAGLVLTTRTQLANWETSKALFQHAVNVNPDNWVARTELGLILAEEGQTQEGIEHYRAALRANPDYVNTHFNLGVALYTLGRVDAAAQEYRTALRLSPSLAEAHNNLGLILLQKGRLADAYSHLASAVRVKPDYVDAYRGLGEVLLRQGNFREAANCLERASRLQPENTRVRDDLARVRSLVFENRRGGTRDQPGTPERPIRQD